MTPHPTSESRRHTVCDTVSHALQSEGNDSVSTHRLFLSLLLLFCRYFHKKEVKRVHLSACFPVCLCTAEHQEGY